MIRPLPLLGIACATGATSLGIVYLAGAGAPLRFLIVQAFAFLLGLALLWALRRDRVIDRALPAATLAMAGLLLAVALAGPTYDGAARWVRLGGLLVQPSFVLLPLMILTHARVRNNLTGTAMAVAALALALQPDRAMAGMLAAGTAWIAGARPHRATIFAALAALAGLGAAMAQADNLPAAPFVEQIFYSAFATHALLGLVVLAGAALLLVPTASGRTGTPEDRLIGWTFGIVWLAALGAAALGNYPTPVVGYGGSAVIGYLLSLIALPAAAPFAQADDREPVARENDKPDHWQRHVPGWAR